MGIKEKKILIVEDDIAIVNLLTKIILMLSPGAEIKRAQNLEQACKNIISNARLTDFLPFDLVVADIFLKGRGTGLDLYRITTAIAPNMPVLTISSLSAENVNTMAGDIEKNNIIFLKKPFSISECTNKIKNILFQKYLPKENYSNIKAPTKYSLLGDADRHQFLAYFMILQISVDWLEKQCWLSEFYGGLNQAHDLLFQARLLINRLWHFLFAKKKNHHLSFNTENLSKDLISECIRKIGNLTLELNLFISQSLICS